MNCKKIEELLVISIAVIIKKLGVNHGFLFPETLEVSKKGTNNEYAMQQFLTKMIHIVVELKKLSSYPIKCYHKFSSKFCICIY